jgi:peptidoglycan/xylan/chitin deacetylase (PgdA/CDA1 family)
MEEGSNLRGLWTLFMIFFAAAPLRQVTAASVDCAYDPARTHLSRIIAAGSTNGPVYGRVVPAAEKPQMRTLALLDHEIVLTFDDGPIAATTNVILDTLDRHCVKATFFPVGGMALLGSNTLREIALRGHTIGSHTWSHSLSFHSMPFERIRAEIEMGFAAVSQAAGQPIAPFFRFPGLGGSPKAADYLASRNISIWSVDVVAGDAERGATPGGVTHNTITRLERLGKGIVLFHDTKRVTAEALDGILTILENDGYKVVHIVSNTAYQPDAELAANSEIFSSMAAAAKAGKWTAPDTGKLNDGPVTVVHNEWIELNPGDLAGQRSAGASGRIQ